MTPPPAKTTPLTVSPLPWAQTSFLTGAHEAGSEAASYEDPSQEAREALRAVDHAVDLPSQRHALDRLTASLTQQARQRGRTPVPKRPS